MKANTSITQLENGFNKKAQITSPFGHTLDTMGGQIDALLCSGKHISPESIIIHLEMVQGQLSARQRLPQNVDMVTMYRMKVVPHLQWLTRKGGLSRCQAVFDITQGNYRHGLISHFVTAFLLEYKGRTKASL